ncbi:hypothetical protein [aff. Roholtiella sp. LEGE 12411]|uniref:hypothetical protein n=1 Tax=aff. Roholtiella sp. LEGE 12411 TaxID=1828822 RepID=UPI0018811522|nr:hypothetical protein [aff. Roholtiella sp. LEGE 12411]MBE9039025.1 hypothetical protein [aff. Roholtiella sp. LEGE 12411]
MNKKQIELRVKGSSIVVKAPFNDGLIEDIKVIPRNQRRWADPEWIIALNDPDQKPDEKTNLEYITDICMEHAQRLNWEFKNFVGKSDSQIEEEKAKSTEELIDEFLAAVDELPNYRLKLVRWNTDNLQLQLHGYLSDEEGGYDLFMRLYRSSEQAYKPTILLGSDRRIHAGFIFTIPYRDRVIRKLIDKKTTYLKFVELEPIEVFEDEIIHFQNATSDLWVGVPMAKSDPGSINWESRDWETTYYENRLYWVVEAKKYIYAWVEESKYSVAHFGGSFGVIFERPNQFLDKVIGFHLEDWLSGHIDEIAKLPPDCRSGRPRKYRDTSWGHPIDKFVGKVAIAPEILESIQSQKQELAIIAIEGDRANAIELAKAKLQDEFDKSEIIEKYGKEIIYKPSWTKKRILEALCTQEFSEKLLEIPAR